MNIVTLEMIQKTVTDKTVFTAINGNIDSFIGVNSLDLANKNEISFCSNIAKNPFMVINSSKAGLIFCPHEVYRIYSKQVETHGFTNIIIHGRNAVHRGIDPILDFHPRTLIFVNNPRLAFIQACILFSPKENPPIIGKGTIIHPTAIIYPNTTIGENCIIHAKTVIGKSGFAYERDENNNLIKFPHFGGVIIGNNVEVGANTVIDRGTINNTIIEDYTKIGNLVHIAHNVKIGKNTLVIASAVIGGSSIIGSYCWIAQNSTIRNGIKIGNKVTVGSGSVVTKSVIDDITVYGNPAKEGTKKKKSKT